MEVEILCLRYVSIFHYNDGEVTNLNLWIQENLEWDGSHFSVETNLSLWTRK